MAFILIAVFLPLLYVMIYISPSLYHTSRINNIENNENSLWTTYCSVKNLWSFWLDALASHPALRMTRASAVWEGGGRCQWSLYSSGYFWQLVRRVWRKKMAVLSWRLGKGRHTIPSLPDSASCCWPSKIVAQSDILKDEPRSLIIPVSLNLLS